MAGDGDAEKEAMTEDDLDDESRVAFVVFDAGEVHLYGRGPDGRVDYSNTAPWPVDWPQYITGRWLRDRGIPFTTA